MEKYILLILIFVISFIGLVSCDETITPTDTPITETTPTEQTPVGYNIIFYTFNKTTDPTTIKNVTSIPTELPVLEVTGYTFDGWYYDTNFTNKVTVGDTLESNVTLYAKFTLITNDEVTPSEPTIPSEPTQDEETKNEETTPDVPSLPTEPTPEATPTPEPIVTYYTITWKNYDGEELEIDTDVLANTIPTYEGITPTKPNSATTYYTFNGWTPEIVPATENAVYTATFTETPINVTVDGTVPVISNDGKTVTYGLYPQTHVNDTTLINTLNTLSAETNGWYLYEGNYYHKETAKLFNSESYKFDDGTAIIDGTTYWFKCEPITWNVLSNDGVNYYLVTSKLLDVQSYYQNYNNRVQNETIIYSNNYEKSDLRTWLNNYFFNTAFFLNNTFITTTNVDNSANTTDSSTNKYYQSLRNVGIYLSKPVFSHGQLYVVLSRV